MKIFNKLKKVLTLLLVFSLSYVAIPVNVATATVVAEPFISEYIEGSGYNKAIEIYNSSSSALNLASGNYSVKMFFNGNSSAGLTINLTGAIASEDVYVLANSSASVSILAQADQTDGSSWYNGNDAVALYRDTTLIDVIGVIGSNPGTEWGTGLTSTADNTLVRKCSVPSGDPNPYDSFDPAIEWNGYVTDAVTNLGYYDCDVVSPTVNITSAQTSPTNISPMNMTATFSEDVTGLVIGDITVGNGIASNLIAVDGKTYTFDVIPTGQGTVTVDITAGVAEDAAANGNIAATQLTIIYDTINPIISNQTVTNYAFSPENVDGIKDSTDIQYDISEDAMVTIKIYDDTDVLVRSLIVDANKLSGNNQDNWDGKDDAATFVPDGFYLAEISATDYAGNTALSKQITSIQVDNTIPLIADMADIVTNIPVNLAGSATDNDTNINYKWVQISGPAGGAVTFDVTDIDPAALASADIEGEYILELTASDRAGNSDSKQIKFTWDVSVNPVTDLYAVTGDGFVDLHWTNPTDTDFAGIVIYRSLVIGELGTKLADLDETKNSFADNLVINGQTYYYIVVAVDELGNESQDNKQITVTPTAPIVLSPLIASTTVLPTGGPENPNILGDQNQGGEVKSGEADQGNNDKGNEDKSALPAVGIALLVILALVGLYLLYLQNPKWFSWLLFWKKKK